MNKVFALLLFLSPIVSIAQDAGKFGPDSLKCRQMLSVYSENMRQKPPLIKDALPGWRYCFNTCPQASEGVYINGAKIFDHLIDQTKDNDALKEKYVDTLFMIYDLRLKYFPKKKGYVLGEKGIDLYKYRRVNRGEEAFNLMDSSITLQGKRSKAKLLAQYMYAGAWLVKNKKRSCEDMTGYYLKVMKVFEANAKKKSKSMDVAKDIALKKADACLTCEILEPIYSKDLEAKKGDVKWVKEAIALLKTKNCSTSDLYLQLNEQLQTLEPSAESASQLGLYYFGKKDYVKAESYLSQAIQLDTVPLKKAEHYYNLATLYFTKGQLAKARTEARNAIALNPNYGEAYVIIGDCYISSLETCKELTLGGREVYWAAVDKYQKAASVSSKAAVKADANGKIKTYSAYFPDFERDLFMKSLKEGDAYKVECWINENTTVRAKK